MESYLTSSWSAFYSLVFVNASAELYAMRTKQGLEIRSPQYACCAVAMSIINGFSLVVKFFVMAPNNNRELPNIVE